MSIPNEGLLPSVVVDYLKRFPELLPFAQRVIKEQVKPEVVAIEAFSKAFDDVGNFEGLTKHEGKVLVWIKIRQVLMNLYEVCDVIQIKETMQTQSKNSKSDPSDSVIVGISDDILLSVNKAIFDLKVTQVEALFACLKDCVGLNAPARCLLADGLLSAAVGSMNLDTLGELLYRDKLVGKVECALPLLYFGSKGNEVVLAYQKVSSVGSSQALINSVREKLGALKPKVLGGDKEKIILLDGYDTSAVVSALQGVSFATMSNSLIGTEIESFVDKPFIQFECHAELVYKIDLYKQSDTIVVNWASSPFIKSALTLDILKATAARKRVIVLIPTEDTLKYFICNSE